MRRSLGSRGPHRARSANVAIVADRVAGSSRTRTGTILATYAFALAAMSTAYAAYDGENRHEAAVHNSSFERAGNDEALRLARAILAAGGGAVTSLFGIALLTNRRRERTASEAFRERNDFERSADILLASLDSQADALAVVDERSEIVAVNEVWRALARERGVETSQALDKAAADAIERLVRDVLTGSSLRGRLEYAWGAAASQRWFELTVTRVELKAARAALIRRTDITERIGRQHELAHKLDVLRALASDRPALIFNRARREGTWHYDLAPTGTAAFLGYMPSEIYGPSGFNSALVHPDDRDRAGAPWQDRLGNDAGLWSEEFRMLSRTGDTRRIRAITQIETGSYAEFGMVGMLLDVTDEMWTKEPVEYANVYDPLTHVHSRRYFEVVVARAAADFSARGELFAILVFEIGVSNGVNDAFGFEAGGELLQSVAQAARLAVDQVHDVVGRLGPESFGVLAKIQRREDATALADRLLLGVQRALTIGGLQLPVSLGFDVSIAGDPEEAQQRTTGSARGRLDVHSEDAIVRTAARATLKHGLAEAVVRDQFVLHYQPKVSLTSGQIVGCEALIRWNRPIVGLQPPARFIPFAEKTSLIVPIGEWVIGEACRQYTRWSEQGFKVVPISVNVSAAQLTCHLPSILKRALAQAGAPPGAIHIEITESVMLDCSAALFRTLDEIRAMGVDIELDDFGTGYSSLGYLKRLPLAAIKIDQSFVRGAITDRTDAAIVRTVVNLAGELNLNTIGEGAETAEQVDFLRAVGCRDVQGFHVSTPLTAANFRRFVVKANMHSI